MASLRMIRVNELLHHEIGNALFRVINDSGFDHSLLTVTQVHTSSDLRTARVMVSIRDNEGRRNSMLHLLRKHRGDIQKFVAQNVILKYTPRLSFELDTSIEEGDKILRLLHDMEETVENPEEQEQ